MSEHGSQTRLESTSDLWRSRHPRTRRIKARGRLVRSSLVPAAKRRFRGMPPGIAAARNRVAMRSMKHSSPGFSLACPVTRFGPIPAPGGTSPLCFPDSSPKTSLGPCSRKRGLALGSRDHCHPSTHRPRAGDPVISLRLRQWVTRPIREFNNGDFTMYQNRITLIGFLGQDASTHTANNSSFTVLSLATKSSYKDKKTGEYNGHTEWHRCIVWGRLSDYAKTLKKGAHLAVEGELRSRERTDKKTGQKERVWEVRVTSILKLDRAEKAGPEESTDVEFNTEEEAA